LLFNSDFYTSIFSMRPAIFLLLPWVILASACQNSVEITESPDPLSMEDKIISEIFDASEVVEAAENDEGTYNYLIPKIYQSPLVIKNNLWDRVRNGFQLDYAHDNSRIDLQLNWFIKNPAYLDRVNTRASRYLWHIVEEIKKRDIPMEIALLPIVESAFDPFAYSHARASGTWQFIPATASFMGMNRDWWYDGRRDILVSTDGALRLLELLHKRLNNDWLLALAAYNTGEGNVRKAIARNKRLGKPTDFWNLGLPKETRDYVPKLLALARLYKEPERYNTYILPIRNEAYFDIVETGSQIDLAQAAALSKTEIEEIYLLNPGLNRWATHPEGPHQLLVPKENAEGFRRALANLPPEERLKWQRYTVESGDTLSTIAQKFNISAHTLASINRLKSSTVNEGASLMMPVASGKNYALSQDQRDERVRKMLDDLDAPKLVHTVKSGESLSTIAKKYRVSTRNMARWNGMAERDVLRVGKKLTVWKKGEPITSKPAIADNPLPEEKPVSTPLLELASAPNTLPPASEDRQIVYKVRSGDSLGKIATRFNTSVSKITAWNNMDKNKILRPGQSLIIYTNLANAN